LRRAIELEPDRRAASAGFDVNGRLKLLGERVDHQA
jgi:hypothetical protein